MDILRAKEIIECLADGVNPLPGGFGAFAPEDVCPPGALCKQPQFRQWELRLLSFYFRVIPGPPVCFG